MGHFVNIGKTLQGVAIDSDNLEDVLALRLFDVHVCDAICQSPNSVVGHGKNLVDYKREVQH